MVDCSRIARGFRAAIAALVPALAVAFVLVVVAPLCAQDDERDLVVLDNGRELRGRVLARFGVENLVLVQGTQKRDVPWASIKSLDTVRDRMVQFFALRDRLPDNVRYQSFLIDWAHRRGLDALARLQAMDVALREPGNRIAHEFLGHRRRGDDWLWPRGDLFLPLADVERYRAEWGHPWEIDSEHFALRCNAELRRAVDALFDLERLYLWWFEELGEPLRLNEALAPKLPIWIWRDREEFPAWASTKLPYFRPREDGTIEPSRSFTYFADAQAVRPTKLFEVATQHLLYRTLADDPALWTQKDRLCGWGEVGLGQYVEQRFGGAPGRAEVRGWRMPELEGRVVLTERSYGLENLLHRSARQFYITVADNTLFEWAASHLFAAWLYDSGDRELRRVFLDYLTAALRDGKGDSSSAFDRLLGRKIESLEAPWREWIKAQLPSPPAPPKGGG